jgi:hypothetical protein
MGVRLGALAAVMISAAGCGGGQSVSLPAVAVGQSAHFRYHARSADRVPVAILDLLEWHWSMMSSFFGLDQHLIVDYYLFDSADDLAKNGPCPTSAAACAIQASVYTPLPFHEHELIHAYFSEQGAGPPIIAEGVASGMTCFEYATAPEAPPADPSWQAAVTSVHEDVTDYGQSRLIRYLIRQRGPQAFSSFYGSVPYTTDPATFASAFQGYWGQSIDDVWAQATATSPAPTYLDVGMCPCNSTPVALDGSGITVTAPFGSYAWPMSFALQAPTSLNVATANLGWTAVRNCWDQDLAMQILQQDSPDNPPSHTLLGLGAGHYYLQVIPNDLAHAAVSIASGDWLSASCGTGQPVTIDGNFTGNINLLGLGSDSQVELTIAGPRTATVSSGTGTSGFVLCPACGSVPADCTAVPTLTSVMTTLNGTYYGTVAANERASISLP